MSRTELINAILAERTASELALCMLTREELEMVHFERGNRSFANDTEEIVSDPRNEGTPEADYCYALALYHINYFGSHDEPDMIERMARQTKRILERYKGELTLHGRVYNTNIVGTFGRVLLNHASRTSTPSVPTEGPLHRGASDPSGGGGA